MTHRLEPVTSFPMGGTGFEPVRNRPSGVTRWPLDRVRVRGNPNPTEARPGFRQTFDPLSGYIPETYFVIAPSTTGRDCGPSAA